MGEIACLPNEVLEKIFSYLDPASVKAASLVSRLIVDIRAHCLKKKSFQDLELSY